MKCLMVSSGGKTSYASNWEYVRVIFEHYGFTRIFVKARESQQQNYPATDQAILLGDDVWVFDAFWMP